MNSEVVAIAGTAGPNGQLSPGAMFSTKMASVLWNAVLFQRVLVLMNSEIRNLFSHVNSGHVLGRARGSPLHLVGINACIVSLGANKSVRNLSHQSIT